MTECFIVAEERSDGKFPYPQKCWHEMLFFHVEDAHEFPMECRKLSPRSKIFKCQIEITEVMDY